MKIIKDALFKENSNKALLPNDWFGFKVIWKEGYSPKPVFIEEFILKATKVFLYGFKIEFKNSTSADYIFTNEYVIIYLVSTLSQEGINSNYYLSQTKSPVFSESDDTLDYLFLDDINDKVIVSDYEKPNPNSNDCIWPTFKSETMALLNQIKLLPGGSIEKKLTASAVVSLFYTQINNKLNFKITAEDCIE